MDGSPSQSLFFSQSASLLDISDMAEVPDMDPVPANKGAASHDDRSKLKQDLDWLEARVDKHEQKLENLMQEILDETDDVKKHTLQRKMKLEKGIVETARKDWERASAAFLDKTVDGDKEARRLIEKANEAMLEISD